MDVHPRTGNLTAAPRRPPPRSRRSRPLPNGVATGQAAGRLRGAPRSRSSRSRARASSHPDKAPNVLILSDGFQVGEQQTFLDLAGLLVQGCAVGARTSPFRELSDRINYFAAFVRLGSPESPPLSPVERFLVPGDPAEATEIDVAVSRRPGPPRRPRTIGAAAHPGHQHALPAQRARHGVRRACWASARGRSASTRSGPPHPHHGASTRTTSTISSAALKDPARQQRRHSTGKRGGKDEVAVLVLCRTDHYGGANNSRAASGARSSAFRWVSSRYSTSNRRLEAPGRTSSPIRCPPGSTSRCAPGRPTSSRTPSRSATSTAAAAPCPRASTKRSRPRPTSRHATPDPLPPEPPRRGLLDAAGKLDADLIKWRWPRLAKADVLSAAPTPIRPRRATGCRSAPATRSRVETSCRLRTRPLPTSVASERLRVRDAGGRR